MSGRTICAEAFIESMDESTHLDRVIGTFVLSRRAKNCSICTLKIYATNLQRFALAIGDVGLACTRADIERYLASLQRSMKIVSVHQHYRVLRTFFSYCVETGVIIDTPMRGIKMKVPKTLPCTPDDSAVQKLIDSCPDTFHGHRNKALVALLADSGLRISEALRLRIGDVDLAARTLIVRGGKAGKDGLGCFGIETARLLRGWLGMRQAVTPHDYLFVDQSGFALSRSHGTHILHRLSVRARLPRKVGPHALRHYAATSILRKTGDLELVRRIMRHETLAMVLRYARLADTEVIAKFEKASPLDNLRAAR